MQSNGVGARPRSTTSPTTPRPTGSRSTSRSTSAPLRELYLPPFEPTVEPRAGVAVMSGYNSVDGVTMTENDLLETPLNSEWGFDGVVISDWTAVRSLAAATASQDLEMPGPDGRVGRRARGGGPRRGGRRGRSRSQGAAAAPLARGSARWMGRAGGHDPPARRRHCVRARAAVEGMVLVRNDGRPAVARPGPLTVAVIGHNARDARTQGGGRATVVPGAGGQPARRDPGGAARARRSATPSARSCRTGWRRSRWRS